MTTFNNTSLTVEEIERLPILGTYRNEWRQRNVTLRRLSEGQVISTGLRANGEVVIAQEPDADHFRALDAFAYGRTYIAR